MLYLARDYPLSSLAFILIYSFSSYCALLTAWSLRQRTLRHATLPVRFPCPDKPGGDRLRFASLDILFLLLAQGSILAAPRTANGLFLRAHFVRGRLIPTKVNQSVTIARNCLPIILVECLNLGHILNNRTG